ncbi:MAG: ABC transporter substrate-binding protein [Candidatus Bathyarchaeia archaeon]
MLSKKAVTKVQLVILAVIVIVAILAGVAYYVTLPTPTPATPTPATPTPATPTPATPTPATHLPSEIRVGAVLCLSGWGSVEGGIGPLEGFQVAIKWINDQGGVNLKGKKVPLKLIYYDCESKEEYAISLTEKLVVEDKVDILMQPWGPFCVATVPVTEKYKVFSSLWAGAPDFLIGQGFTYCISPHIQLGGGHRWPLWLVHQIDPEAKTVANIYRAEPGAVLWGEAARKFSKEYGLTIVYDKSYPPDMTDFAPLLREIAAVKPDILCMGSTLLDGRLIVTQLRDLKIDIKYVTLSAGANKPDFGESLGKWAAGFMGNSPYEPEAKWEVIAAKEGKEYYGPTNDEVLKYWRAMGGKGRPSTEMGMAVGGLIVTVKCIEEAQTLEPGKLVEVAKQLDIYTCRGRFKIDPNEPLLQIGSPSPPLVYQWQRKDNKLVYSILYPFDFATSTIVPMPTWEEKEKWPELEVSL